MTFERSAGSNTQSSWARVDCWPSRSVRLVNLGVVFSEVDMSRVKLDSGCCGVKEFTS